MGWTAGRRTSWAPAAFISSRTISMILSIDRHPSGR